MSFRFLGKGASRAATPAFRLMGGADEARAADAVLPSAEVGMHRGEWLALGLLIPWVAWVAVFDFLWRLGGPWVAWLAVWPGFWLLLHGLAFALGVSRPVRAWWCWSVLPTLWSIWAMGQDGGLLRVTAGMWWAMMLLQGLGILGLLWWRIMRVAGWAGVVWRISMFLLAHVGMLLVWLRWGWQMGLAVGLMLGGAWCWVTFRPRSCGFGEVLCRSAGGRVLTIDDGPDPEVTPGLLDLLDRHGRKAVFFVIGEKVRRHPELAREIIRRGHELGNHTMSHPQAWMWGLGPWRTRWEIREGQRAIEEITGVTPRWFRAPVGHRNGFTHPFAHELGLEVVAWTRRGYDTVERDVAKIVRALSENPRPDDVLLIHDGTPIALELLAKLLEAEARRERGN
ncbi:MAG: polysaccharide deacetylase family protein [Akkermansiaceae bacterium]|jgi:peptidoglycan/xylan/chitin deacetylase (PgdA/CDA1 family)|nr:polysaccharide deacetylase family protein [Akkermansiaceae bacterium]